MSTFADFALLAAVPSYGGAEILRAQRVLPMGPGPRVHLALFGRNDAVTRRVVAAANAGAAILHPAIARIYEVARYDGVVYGVGDPSEGLDLAALMGGGPVGGAGKKQGIPLDFALAIVATLGRVGVAIHDAGGPGYRGPPLGLGAVLSGGLSLDTVFLEPNGAVRIRPLAAAGNDPDAPSAFRAPEGDISMAADVYALGRVLMALLSGDPTGRTVPRLPTSSTLPAFLGRMIHKRAAERAHLHEVVTRLEGLMREQGASSADQVIRAALAGTWRSLVVDPGFGMDPPVRVVDGLRMQLAFIYPAIERLWPTMTPSVTAPPPPPAFAALPPSTSGEGNPVFTDARPVRRQKAKTAATVLFNPAEARGALPPAVSGEGGAFKPKTSPTLMIPTADLLRSLPAPGQAQGGQPSSEKTQMIDPASFTPFAPPPAGPPKPPVVPPKPPVVTPRAPIVTPPPARRSDARPVASRDDNVFAAGGTARDDDRDDDGGDDHDVFGTNAPGSDEDDAFEERTQMLPPEEAASVLLVRRKPPADAAAIADAFDAAFEDGDVFADDAAMSAPAPPVATSVAPPPSLSEPGGPTDAYMVANASTALGGRHDATESSGPPRHTASRRASRSDSDDSNDSDDIQSIDDGADFVMVGEAGQTFEGERNPFKASTRLYPAQAMQKARSGDGDGADERGVDDNRQGADDVGDDDERDVFSQEGVASSATIPSQLDGDDIRTEMVSADHVASMLRGIEAARAPAPEVSQEGPAPTQLHPRQDSASQTRAQRPRPVSGLSSERPRLQTPPTPRQSVPDAGAFAQLLVEAPDGATVSVNGTVVGTGPTMVDVSTTSRCVVKVTLAGHVPFSTVVMMQGRPRVRVRPALKPR